MTRRGKHKIPVCANGPMERLGGDVFTGTGGNENLKNGEDGSRFPDYSKRAGGCAKGGSEPESFQGFLTPEMEFECRFHFRSFFYLFLFGFLEKYFFGSRLLYRFISLKQRGHHAENHFICISIVSDLCFCRSGRDIPGQQRSCNRLRHHSWESDYVPRQQRPCNRHCHHSWKYYHVPGQFRTGCRDRHNKRECKDVPRQQRPCNRFSHHPWESDYIPRQQRPCNRHFLHEWKHQNVPGQQRPGERQ